MLAFFMIWASLMSGTLGADLESSDSFIPLQVALKTDDPLIIDGKLTEPQWFGAPLSVPFRPNRDGLDVQRTTVMRLAYDRQALYVAVHCEVPANDLPVIQRKDDHATNLNADDTIELFFDPGLSRNHYIQLIVNRAGKTVVGVNGVYEPARSIDAKVAASDSDWELEVRVPWSALGSVPYAGDLWGMNAFRTRQKREDHPLERWAWSTTRGGHRQPQQFGHLLFGSRNPQMVPAVQAEQELIFGEILDTLDRNLRGLGRWTEADMSREAAQQRAQDLMALNRRLTRLDEPLLVASTLAITDQPIFPWSVPARDALDPVVEIAACPDEFEPASLILFATRDMRKVTAKVVELANEAGEPLSAEAVDLALVKCWYQSGWPHVTRTGRCLVPELLLHDDSLIDVDFTSRTNILNFSGLPADTATLMDFEIPAYTAKQLWLTFHPPPNTKPGVYKGWLDLKEDRAVVASIPLTLTVHPFELAASRLSYSLYYRLRPSKTPDAAATMERMGQEIRNQVEHGINMPSTYIGTESLREGGLKFEALEELTQLYRSLGLIDHPLILVTQAIGTESTPEQLEGVRERVRTMKEWASLRGYSDVIVQAKDEADAEILRRERPAMQAVHEAGGKVFVACSDDYFEAAGDVLDMPVVSGALRPDLAQRVHKAGHRIFSYGNPQAGVELPETYRRNYGLKLWAAGYDGGFDYEYQALAIESAYDDFTEEHYRNHTMAYPAMHRPIDTRQWEGWREGVDDVRYLSTLLDALEGLEASERDGKLASETRKWVESLSGNEDLRELRREMVARITKLRQANRAGR